jgi:hypothetical protein
LVLGTFVGIAFYLFVVSLVYVAIVAMDNIYLGNMFQADRDGDGVVTDPIGPFILIGICLAWPILAIIAFTGLVAAGLIKALKGLPDKLYIRTSGLIGKLYKVPSQEIVACGDACSGKCEDKETEGPKDEVQG